MSYVIMYAHERDNHALCEIVFNSLESAESHLATLQEHIEMYWWDIRHVVVVV